jgi:hypothetical protein
MSKQNEDGRWEHRLWCNYLGDGPCKCCDNKTDWPYLSDLKKNNPGLSVDEAIAKEVARNWPDAVPRPGTGPS